MGHLPLLPYQKEVILGTVLGDGHLDRRDSGNIRLHMTHSPKQREYIMWKYEMLKPICSTMPTISNAGHGYSAYQLNTVNHPFLSEVYHQITREGKKMIRRTFLNRLTPLSLAVWYMDDGGLMDAGKRNKDGLRKQVIARLYTCSFTVLGCHRIVRWLKVRFGIETKVKIHKKKSGKNYPYIRFNTTNTRKLIEVIKPHVINSMRYKIDFDLVRKIQKLSMSKTA